MEIKFIRYLFLVFILYGCNKADISQKEIYPDRNGSDLIPVTKDQNSFGYYKSSIIKVNGNTQVWLHMPGASQSSKNDIERVSDFLTEISCELHSIRIIKSADIQGNTIIFKDDKVQDWSTPSPADDFYKVIISVCNENSKQ